MRTKMSKAAKIREMLAEGKTVKEISKKLGVSANYVYATRWHGKKNAVEAKPGKKAKVAVRKAKKELQSFVSDLSSGLLAQRAKDEAELTRLSDTLTSHEAQQELPMFDNVNHPPHYIVGGIETIDFIEAKRLNYNRGNALKYLTRAGFKNGTTEIEDLKKAEWYLNREIERLQYADSTL